MKNLSRCIATALVCMSTSVIAQTSDNDTSKDLYVDGLTKYFTTSTIIDNYRQGIIDFLISDIEEHPEIYELKWETKAQIKNRAKDIATRYVEEVMPYDCARLISAQAKSLVDSLEMAAYSPITPQAMSDAAIARQSLARLYDDKFITVAHIFAKSAMQDASKAISAGKKPVKMETIYTDSHCAEFVKVPQVLEIVTPIADATRTSWLNSGAGAQKAAAMEKYVLENYPIAIMNKLPNVPSEQQLRAYNQIESVPAKMKLNALEFDDNFTRLISLRSQGWAIYYGYRHEADDYSRAVTEFCQKNSASFASSMSPFISRELRMTGVKCVNQDREAFLDIESINAQTISKYAGQCVGEYLLDGSFMSDVAYLFVEPSFRDNISIEEMSAISAMNEQAEVKQAFRHMTAATSSQKYLTQTTNMTFKFIGSIGGKPDNLKAEKCPKTYVTAFNEFFQASNQVEKLFESMESLLESKIKEQKQDVQTVVNSYKNYLQKNLPIAMCNACKDSVSEQDLAVLTAYYKNPTVQKVETAKMEMMKVLLSQSETISERIMYRFFGWMLYFKTKDSLAEKPRETTQDSANEDDPQEQVFTVVEQQPEFPGGEAALLYYIKTNLKYPAPCVSKGIQGRVTLSFIIGKTGIVSNIQVISSPDSDLSAEAIRVVRTMPRWKPGRQRGKYVRVKYVLPITFRLSSK